MIRVVDGVVDVLSGGGADYLERNSLLRDF